jgi:hypothetical protein
MDSIVDLCIFVSIAKVPVFFPDGRRSDLLVTLSRFQKFVGSLCFLHHENAISTPHGYVSNDRLSTNRVTLPVTVPNVRNCIKIRPTMRKKKNSDVAGA